VSNLSPLLVEERPGERFRVCNIIWTITKIEKNLFNVRVDSPDFGSCIGEIIRNVSIQTSEVSEI